MAVLLCVQLFPASASAAEQDHTVLFVSEGSVVATRQVAAGSTIDEIIFPSKAGSSFIGWYEDRAFTEPWDFGNDTVASDVSLYAKFLDNPADTYRVFFNTNGADPIHPATVQAGDSLNLPVPVKTGGEFGGWFEDAACTIEAQPSYSPDQDTILWAKWIEDTYTVTFDSQGGSIVPPLTDVSYNSLIAEPSAPTKAGFLFTGWAVDAEGMLLWDFSTDRVIGDATLFAQWEPEYYPVTFDSQGGIPSQTTVLAQFGSLLVPPADPLKPGEVFVGWFMDPEGTIPWSFSYDVVTGPLILYAKWNIAEVTVIFDSQGGSAVAPQTLPAGSLATRPPDPTRTSYQFQGWYRDAQGITPWNFSTDVVDANMTLYAQWIPLQYTVIFDSQGGTPVPAQIVMAGSLVLQPTSPSRAGYIFRGWYRNPQATDAWVFSTDVVTQNTTLYAGWTRAFYLVTFDSQGGGYITPQQVNPNGYIIPPAKPVRPGYMFAGWHKDISFQDSWDFSVDEVVSATTLYAFWIPDSRATAPITLDAAGGFFSGGSSTAKLPVETGDTVGIQLPSNPQRAGYVFGGWYYEPTSETLFDFGDTQMQAPLTLYAKWEAVPATYDVFFNSLGGSAVAPQYGIVPGQTASAPIIPTRDGYVFEGWYSDRSLLSPVTFPAVFGQSTILFAKWSTITPLGPSDDLSPTGDGVPTLPWAVALGCAALAACLLRATKRPPHKK